MFQLNGSQILCFDISHLFAAFPETHLHKSTSKQQAPFHLSQTIQKLFLYPPKFSTFSSFLRRDISSFLLTMKSTDCPRVLYKHYFHLVSWVQHLLKHLQVGNGAIGDK